MSSRRVLNTVKNKKKKMLNPKDPIIETENVDEKDEP